MGLKLFTSNGHLKKVIQNRSHQKIENIQINYVPVRKGLWIKTPEIKAKNVTKVIHEMNIWKRMPQIENLQKMTKGNISKINDSVKK